MLKFIHSLLFASALVLAAAAHGQGLPGATVKPGGASADAAGDRQAARERCRANPEQCRADMQALVKERCAADPQKCEAMKKEFEARREQCKADPEKCKAELRTKFDERFKKADANGDGALSRAEAEKGMPRLARHFDELDANHDGQVTPDELQAALQKRRSALPTAAPDRQG
jgi:hypothetical protein